MPGPATYDPSSASEQPVPLPDAPIHRITEILSVQPPLSRRGHGPGLLLFVSDDVSVAEGLKPLDPEPVQKWAEEGFAVAFAVARPGQDVQKILADAATALIGLGERLDIKDKLGVVGESDAVVLLLDRPQIIHFQQCMTTRYSTTCSMPLLETSATLVLWAITAGAWIGPTHRGRCYCTPCRIRDFHSLPETIRKSTHTQSLRPTSYSPTRALTTLEVQPSRIPDRWSSCGSTLAGLISTASQSGTSTLVSNLRSEAWPRLWAQWS